MARIPQVPDQFKLPEDPTKPPTAKSQLQAMVIAWYRWIIQLVSSLQSINAQQGTQDVTHTTAAGALFTGSAAITFPKPFTVVPVVNCSAGAGTGFCAWPTAITQSGFTLNVMATASGTTTANLWTAAIPAAF